MRNFKFRAWDKMYDDFINDGYIIFNGMIYRDERDFEDGQNTNDIELMQYTGLLDKNGLEIYEGDIVKGISRSPKKHYIGKLHFDCIYGSWVVHGYDTEFSHMKFELSIPLGECRFDIEVIGNIYENPELLND